MCLGLDVEEMQLQLAISEQQLTTSLIELETQGGEGGREGGRGERRREGERERVRDEVEEMIGSYLKPVDDTIVCHCCHDYTNMEIHCTRYNHRTLIKIALSLSSIIMSIIADTT